MSGALLGRFFVVETVVAFFACAAAITRAESPASPLPYESTAKIDPADLPPRTTPIAPEVQASPAWLGTHLRIGHLPGFSERMVGEFLKDGYNVITLNASTKWDRVGPSASLYPADEVKQADAYLRKTVDTIHKAGAKSILYIGPVQVPWLSKPFAEAHPDWLPVNPDGKHPKEVNLASIRGGYVDWLCEQLAFVVRTYGVDGFWFDGFAPVHLHTYDRATRNAFKAFSGGEDIPPPGDWGSARTPLARKYLKWHEQYFLDVAGRIEAAVKAANPEAVVFGNHSGCRMWWHPNTYMGEYPLGYSQAIDVSSIELFWDTPGDALFQQFNCAFMQALTDGTKGHRHATVWMQPSEHGISGVASRVETQLRTLEGLAWGVYGEFVEAAGREEYHSLHAKNIKAREEWMENSEPVPYVGIVASEQTRRLYGNRALPEYFAHTLGTFRALVERHIPVRVLTEYDLEAGDLHGVRVLMLPNVACMSSRAVEVVRRFVREGGGLIASLETSLVDTDRTRRKDFALADLFHASYVRTHPVNLRAENVYLHLETTGPAAKHPIIDDEGIRQQEATAWLGGDGPPPADGPLALIATSAEVDASEGGTVLARYNLNEPDQQNARYPAIIASTFGKGRVVYFAAGVDKVMFLYPDGYQRALLANACRWAAGDATPPPVEVDGPLLLATTVRRQPQKNRLIVHLLNDQSSYGRHSIYQKLAPLPKELQERYGFPNESELTGTWPIREEVIPLHDIKVRCHVPGVGHATQQPENVSLAIRKLDHGGVEVVVPKLEMHSMVVFEP